MMYVNSRPLDELDAAEGGSNWHLYDPESWREQTVARPTRPHIPRHWRGIVPDPEVARCTPRGPGDVSVPYALLTSGLSDLQVLLWAHLRAWFYWHEGDTDYEELASELLGYPPTPAKVARIGTAIRPMLGTWVLRRRVENRRWLYQTGTCFATGDPWTRIRGDFFAELAETGQDGPESHQLADVVNFVRWQLECGDRGWTIESADRLGQEWKVPSTKVVASRERLTRLGWLTTFERSSAEAGHLVWITERFDPQQAMVEITDSHRERSASYWQFPKDLVEVTYSRRGQTGSYWRFPDGLESSDEKPNDGSPIDSADLSALHADLAGLHDHLHANFEWQLVTVSFAELNDLLDGCLPAQHVASLAWWERVVTSRRWLRAIRGRTTELDLERRELRFQALDVPLLPAVDGLRHRRSHRRRRAYADLLAPRRPCIDPTHKWDAHEVYLLHFPAERCFKVGLARCGSGRIAGFVRRGGVVVERVQVGNGPLAEVIEADVLALTEEWHRLGDRHRLGGGYTEMWSDSGPSVDLREITLLATLRLARLRDELDVGSP